jgi:hypothetical protein
LLINIYHPLSVSLKSIFIANESFLIGYYIFFIWWIDIVLGAMITSMKISICIKVQIILILCAFIVISRLPILVFDFVLIIQI